MKRISYAIPALLVMACLFLPDLVAAAGPSAPPLIVVADNRVVQSSITKFWIDQYNVDPFMYGLYCTIFTGILGVSLGLLTDQIMKHTGIDLTSRKIVEH